MRSVGPAGALFAVLVTAGGVLLGDVIGSFADADRVLVDHFAEDGNRVKDIVGSYLLLAAAACLVWFALAVAERATERPTAMIVTGALAAGATMLSAVSFLAVPLNISFGDLTGDPGLGEGQAVLPQLGVAASRAEVVRVREGSGRDIALALPCALELAAADRGVRDCVYSGTERKRAMSADSG